MQPDLREMHSAFLTEISAARERLLRELDRLGAVEEYHRSALDSLTPAGENGHIAEQSEQPTDVRLADASRHAACEIALQALGGRAKTRAIADWLRGHGVGREFADDRTFDNTCYTAMNRRTDMFHKTNPGEWELLHRD